MTFVLGENLKGLTNRRVSKNVHVMSKLEKTGGSL